VDWPTTSLPTSFPGVHYQCLDMGVSDEEVSDKEVTDKGVSDEKVTDKGVSEKEVSDEEVTDEGISDKVSDKEVTDEVTDEEDRLEDRDKDIDEDSDEEEELEIMKLEESLGETFKENRKENVVELLEKRVKHDRDESALSTPVPSAKIRIGNILPSLFKYSRDKLWMRDDNIINFVSCDGVLTTPIGRELINHSLVRSSDIKAAKGEIGYITSIRKRGKFVYNLFIKKHSMRQLLQKV
jgi:hypothetical protein